ncbi:hypothetical protein L083_0193 [Actinoplanes sp. N902-109]|nr:hypothetical protein L083_0193 [Actinoplanes sp. N902-109]
MVISRPIGSSHRRASYRIKMCGNNKTSTPDSAPLHWCDRIDGDYLYPSAKRSALEGIRP